MKRPPGRARSSAARLAGRAGLVLACGGLLGVAWRGMEAARRAPAGSTGPGAAERPLLDTLPPTRPVRLLWLGGRAAQPSAGGAVVTDGAGDVLLLDERLQVRRPPLALEGREVLSAAAAPGGGLWLVDGGGELLHADPVGRVRRVPGSPFGYAAVAATPRGGHAWLVRSAERFGYTLPDAGAPLLAAVAAGGRPRPLGRALLPAHSLLAELANAGHLAVSARAVFYAPFIRDEVLALSARGDTLWLARRGLPQGTAEPRFEIRQGRAVIDYHPVNLGLALGPDGNLYVLSTPGFTTLRSRLDVLEPATGRLLRTLQLPSATPTLAVDAQGRVYLLDAARLLTGVAARERPRLAPLSLPLLGGGRLESGALRGRVVLLNVWASWCAPCRAEMPALDSLQRSIDEADFTFLTLSEDRDAGDARGFVERFGFHFPVLLGGGRMRERLHYPGLPYTLLLDREGRIVQRWTGFAGAAQLREIRSLLAAELRSAPPGSGGHLHQEPEP